MYNIGVILFKFIFKNFFKCQIVGVENIPSTKGVIIAANHISLWDLPIIGTFLPRKINFMAKEELFDIPIIGYIIKRLNAFPVKSGTVDRVAIKKAISLLKSGECLGLFPEGTRSKDGKLGEAEAGMALIAIKADVPVVPTAVIIKKNKFWGNEIKLIFGKPIKYQPNEDGKIVMQEFTDEIMREIGKLMSR